MAKIFETELTKKEILKYVGHSGQLMGARRMTIDEGPGKGTAVIRVRNGIGLDITILPDRGLDIWEAYYKGIPLAWISKSELIANTHYDDKGAGWLRSFNGGLLTTCGLRNVGVPVETEGESFGVHGRYSNTPATHINIHEYWEDDEFYIKISGKIREAITFGENLVVNRTITLSTRDNTIDIHDQIVNESFRQEEYMLLYHFNWGYPLVNENLKVDIDVLNTEPRDFKLESPARWQKFNLPTHNFQEEVFFHDVKPDQTNQCKYQLTNHKIGLQTEVKWNRDVLDHLVQWKMPGEGDYVLGMEPANCRVMGRAEEKKTGRIKKLDSFEEKNINIVLTIRNI